MSIDRKAPNVWDVTVHELTDLDFLAVEFFHRRSLDRLTISGPLDGSEPTLLELGGREFSAGIVACQVFPQMFWFTLTNECSRRFESLDMGSKNEGGLIFDGITQHDLAVALRRLLGDVVTLG